MIRLYCKGKHKTKRGLCPDCKALMEYCEDRVNHCPFTETKTFCSACKVHCYRQDRREQIRTVMRYAGPRMILYHPIPALRHLYVTIKEQEK